MLLVFLWLQFPRFAASAPIAITNGQQFTSWQSEPPIRGTFSLLTNCLITLTLCVWTAVHLNIVAEKSPEEQSGFLQRISNSVKFRKLKWVLLGLLAPELVVYTAWRQWSSAQELTREMQRILVERADKTGAVAMTEWTIVHSFYAGMGGFVIDLSSNFGDKTYIHGNALQMTLTAQGVLFLVSAGYDLPSISRETILDHSKADGLAKALVCLQAGYMLIQCAARVRSHLALSFLEINTLGHVVCALTMYLFWLKKPQDVRTTSRMSDEDIQPLCAYMYMESSLSRAYDGNKREFSRLRHLDRSLPQSPRKEPMEPVHSEISAVLQAPLPPESSICTLHGGDLLVETGIGPRTGLTRRTRRGRADVIVYQRPAVHLGTIDVLRWKLAWQFIENCKLLKQYQLRELLHRFVASELGVDLVVAEVPNWPHDAGLLPRSLHSTWVAISLAVGLYGGLHAAAWNAHFPTTAERVMWCTSSILVTASGPLAMMYIYLKWFFGERGKNAGICLALFTGALMIFGGMIFLAVVGGLLAYIPARIFLVVEAFISLRDMPVEVYQTPNWTQLIPHL